MSGRLDATPWARAAIGDLAALRERIPEGHTLHVSGRTATGPWHATVLFPGGHVAQARYDQPDLRAVIDAVLEAIS